MMKKGNIRKLEVRLDGNQVCYSLRLYDVLDAQKEVIDFNELVSRNIKISFTGNIHCVITGKKIPKAYGEGMSWDAFQTSPMADQSIVKPELSTAHLGIPRRDYDWELKNHVVPHFVYLSFTSDFKVGVTRYSQIPTRWIDQGAIAAVKIAETPYRQAAGLIEVALKDFVKDKTNWRNMIKNQSFDLKEMEAIRNKLIAKIPSDFEPFVLKNEPIQILDFPILTPLQKVSSMKLDKTPVIEGKLIGIKGQYLLFEDQKVMNMRAHTAYEIEIEY
ncbi:MAG: DUF2797 domain-containing protein [Flavobacteriales bacterium]|jgi:hypothetical protein|nr:DUF2797 domain-containing protein [Flavobacteriales bacterium]